MNIILFSDLHLSLLDNYNSIHDITLSNYLNHNFGINEPIDKTIILGDLIETYQAVFISKKDYLKKIKEKYCHTFDVIENNENVILINGNHDDGTLKYLRNEVYDNIILDGYWFEHGHLCDKYFKSEFRNDTTKVITKSLYCLEGLIHPITNFYITKKYLDYQKKKRLDCDFQIKYANDFLRKRGDLKGVVMAHTHVACSYRLKYYGGIYSLSNEKQPQYINTGSYMYGDVYLLNTKNGIVRKINAIL